LSIDPLIEPSFSLTEPHLTSDADLSDLVRDLNLAQNRSKLLASTLKGWNLLQKGTKMSLFCSHQKEFLSFFFSGRQLKYCNIADALMEALGQQYDRNE
jgi:hypothetical protein